MRGGPRLAAVLLAAALALIPPREPAAQGAVPSENLKGRFLVAAPDMPDPRFAGAVIYMIRHGPDGAMGFVVNRVLAEDWAENILDPGSAPARPEGRKIAVHYGGPVETQAGFILHSADYPTKRSVRVAEDVWLSDDPGILREMGRREGRGLFVLGYSGWAPGQLESELARDDWAIAPGDTRLLYDPDLAGKWRRAWANRGVEL